jgi:hypothetical protein
VEYSLNSITVFMSRFSIRDFRHRATDSEELRSAHPQLQHLETRNWLRQTPEKLGFEAAGSQPV